MRWSRFRFAPAFQQVRVILLQSLATDFTFQFTDAALFNAVLSVADERLDAVIPQFAPPAVQHARVHLAGSGDLGRRTASSLNSFVNFRRDNEKTSLNRLSQFRGQVHFPEIRAGIQRLSVLDTSVDALDMSAALAFVDRCVRWAERPACILAVNPEKVYVLRKDPRLKALFESAALLLPDGIGIVAAARFLHGARLRRTPGADLMQHICTVAPERGYRIFVLGASENVNAAAVNELRQRFAGIHIVGRANGYGKPENNSDLIRRINASCADILFVALGSPRQECWIEANLPHLSVKVCQGIGGTLDTIVGTVKRAPHAWQALGLEWAYRLLRQPSRARRQLKLVAFVSEVVSLKLSRRTV